MKIVEIVGGQRELIVRHGTDWYGSGFCIKDLCGSDWLQMNNKSALELGEYLVKHAAPCVEKERRLEECKLKAQQE